MSAGTDLVLAKIDQGRLALSEARTLSGVKQVADIASAMETYSKRQKLGEEAEGYARELRLDAERKLGEMLLARPHAKPGPKQELGIGPLPNYSPTLVDLGIDKMTSSRAQRLAGMPDESFAAVKSGEKSVTQVLRDVRAKEIARDVSLPDAKYRVIYADPPWSYGNTQPDYHTEQRDHYPVMSMRDICALPIATISEDNAVLFLWVTSPILEESFEVIRSWGFKYKASFVWDKIKHNMGHYNSVRHEFLLICTRGSGTPEVAKLFDSVVSEERTTHSQKPSVFYEIIETLYPSGKRIELFARNVRIGWDAYGHQADVRAA